MRKLAFLIFTLILTLFACNHKQNKQVKYIFLFIGDGMGINHAYISDLYLKNQNIDHISFLQFPYQALTQTSCLDTGKITDSGAGGTAIATGHKTHFHAIGLNRQTGEVYKTIAEILHQKGWKIGIISSVALNHATPASFYAHVEYRNMYNEIAKQLWQSGFEFFGGGGLLTRGNPDSLLKIFYDSLKANGYKIAFDKKDFEQTLKNASKVYLMDTASLSHTALYYMIDSLSRVSLADFTKAAIKKLYSPDGFFIMVEGGKIDWASHNNDILTAIYELLDFDKAVRIALDFYKKHPDETIIIVTADHETGGLSLGYSQTGYNTYLYKLAAQTRSKEYLVNYLLKSYPESYQLKLKKYIHYDFQVSDTLKPVPMVNTIIDQLQHSAGTGWTSSKHTANLIATYAIGQGAENFKGIIDNTDIFKILKKLTLGQN